MIVVVSRSIVCIYVQMYISYVRLRSAQFAAAIFVVKEVQSSTINKVISIDIVRVCVNDLQAIA